MLANVVQRLGFSLPAVFIASSQRSLSVPKPANQNSGQLATIVLSGTRGPWLFLVIREGLGSAVRLRARGTQRLTNQLRLALEPKCLENPTATAREDPQDGADSIKDTQAVCGFRCWASKHAPLSVSSLVRAVRRHFGDRRCYGSRCRVPWTCGTLVLVCLGMG